MRKRTLLNLSDPNKTLVHLSLSTVYLITVMTMVKNTNIGEPESCAFLRHYYNHTLLCNIFKKQQVGKYCVKQARGKATVVEMYLSDTVLIFSYHKETYYLATHKSQNSGL